jgi:hypothetical protein
MYRITTLLNDDIAARMIAACCHPDSCLKRRLWTVEGLTPDQAEEKSMIPCLQPCAILLEFARKVTRWEQEGKLAGRGESSALEPLAGAPDGAAPAECDFDAPTNPRRVRFVLEKRGPTFKPTSG